MIKKIDFEVFRNRFLAGKKSKLAVFVVQSGGEYLSFDIENAPIVLSSFSVGKKYKIVHKRGLTLLESILLKTKINATLEKWCKSEYKTFLKSKKDLF